MSPVRQFMFESDFSDPDAKAAEEEVVEEEEPEIEEPEVDLFSEEDMQAARDAAFEQGRRQAEADFLASMEAEILSLIRDIAANLTQVSAIQERENAKRTGEAVTVAHAICRKIVPALFEKNGVEEVAHQVREAVRDLSAAPRILLTVAPALRGPLSERIGHITAGSGYDGRIEILEDKTLEHGDCLMAWGDGGSERRMADIWNQVNNIVADGAENVVKSAERAYLRVAGPEAEIEADSHPAAPPPAAQTPEPAPAPEPASAPETAPEAAAPGPADAPQPLETAAEIEDSPAPAAAAAAQPGGAAEASAPEASSEDKEIEAILSSIDESAASGAEDSRAETGAEDGAEDDMTGAAADIESGTEAAPLAAAPPPPPAPEPEPEPAPRAAPQQSGPPQRMEGLGIELDTSEPGGEVDDALDKALGVLSGKREPDAPPPGMVPGGMQGAGQPPHRPEIADDDDESVFGEIVDDALDIALGALSQKKKK